MKTHAKTKTSELPSRIVSKSKFEQTESFGYQAVLKAMKDKPDKILEINCGSKSEAKKMQSGFHSSAVARQMKKQGYVINTRVLDSVIQLSVSSIVNVREAENAEFEKVKKNARLRMKPTGAVA